MLRFELTRLRQKGALYKRWELGHQAEVEGNLHIDHAHDPIMQRTTMVATLHAKGGQTHCLWDARLATSIGMTYLALDGVERVEVDPGRFVDYVQTWTLRPLPVPEG